MAEKTTTLRQFGEKLDEYATGGAARRAVGRFGGWSDADKEKARRMIDARFGPAETAAAKAPKKGKRSTAKMAEAPKKRGRPAKAKSEEAPKRKGTSSPKAKK